MRKIELIDKLQKYEYQITKLLKNISALFFFIIIILVISLVILRYVFNSGIYGGNELMSFLFIYTTALGAVVSVARNDHIRICVFVDRIRNRGIKKGLVVLALLLTSFINGVMVYYSISWIRSVGGNQSPVLRIPNMLIQICIPVSCSLAVLYSLYQVFLYLSGHANLDEKCDGGMGA